MMAGRPRQFSNAAEKQKDYRERKKAEIIASELALALLQEAEEQKVTLLSYANYYRIRGQKITITRDCVKNCQMRADDWPRGTIENLLMNHLIRTETVQFARRVMGHDVYEFSPGLLEAAHDLDTARIASGEKVLFEAQRDKEWGRKS